jgi:Ca-activated chloride channel homolog
MNRKTNWTMSLTRICGVILIVGGSAAATVAQSIPGLSIDLDLVLVPATVTDDRGGVVRDLDAGDFRLWEDRVEQDIRYFSTETVPASIGIVLDTSHSMSASVELTHKTVRAFLQAGHSEDEYFLIQFDDEARLHEDFTPDIDRLNRSVLGTAPEGGTALYDAVYRAIAKAQEGQHARKVILIISDGEDTNSRYSLSEIEDYVRESGVQIYALGISALFGKTVLRDLTDLTGGKAIFADANDDLETMARQLATEMTSQYMLGYVSTNDDRDGAWRELRVRAASEESEEAVDLTVRARRGYYARSF